MGESPATYAHVDAVNELTTRIRREFPAALAVAVAAAPDIHQALRRSIRKQEGLLAIVALFEQLTSTELAHLPQREKAADEVITAALHVTSGIDWTATSVQVNVLDPGSYRVRLWDGSGSTTSTVQVLPGRDVDPAPHASAPSCAEVPVVNLGLSADRALADLAAAAAAAQRYMEKDTSHPSFCVVPNGTVQRLIDATRTLLACPQLGALGTDEVKAGQLR
ncbi:hypothetical protein OHQ88_34260 (plasmid) [Micromonospora zamorensis]|uniref:hypothetical protein n=1 Tax=Micromonospora zamorensis TaxID=709883 RepID=UPI002E1CA8C4